LSREEWRQWMLEKEAIIKKSNAEKSKLIQVFASLSSLLTRTLAFSPCLKKENQNLRKALTSSSLQIFHELQATDSKIQQLQTDLADAQVEIQKLQVKEITPAPLSRLSIAQMELKYYREQFQNADHTGVPPVKAFKKSSAFAHPLSSPIEAILTKSFSSSCDEDSDKESSNLNSEDDEILDSIDQYLQRKKKVPPPLSEHQERNETSFVEADLTYVPTRDSNSNPLTPTQTSVRRKSLDRVKSRPLQVRDQTKSVDTYSTPPPPPPIHQIDNIPPAKIIQKSEILPATLPPPPETVEIDEEEEESPNFSIYDAYGTPDDVPSPFENNEMSSSHSAGSSSVSSSPREYPFAYQSPSEGPAPWVHDYITGVKERHHNSPLRDDMLSFPSPTKPSHSSGGWLGTTSSLYYHPSLENLPRAINETALDPTDSHTTSHMARNKKPLCRDTLITGREHGLFQTGTYNNNNHDPSPSSSHSPSQSTEKRKLHPLQLALKNNISRLAVPASAYAPNSLSKSPPSNTPPHSPHSKLLSRESQRTLPSSQRYLIGVTTASAGKMKRSLSGPMGAVRGSNEWK
jgi:hypothetical protein